MKPLFAAAAAAALASAAVAAAAYAEAPFAPGVTVDIGPALAAKAQRILISSRDLDELRADLARDVGRVAAGHPDKAPVRLDLSLDDAVPNRPTFEQQGREPNLSFLGSIGLGGAAISGTATLADGSQRPVSFRWYETDLANELGPSTWTDADRAFDLFAERVGQGDLRPYSIGSTSRSSGDFVHRFPGD